MKVLLISHWYKPVKSPVKRMARIAEFLARNNDVTVLTSLPSYPTGILPEEYRNKLWDVSYDQGIKIIRIWDLPTPNKGFLRRTLNHAMFFISSSIAVFFKSDYDIVIVSSPSFLAGMSGILAAKLSKGKFIFDVRDLWPDSAFELGYRVNPLIRRILKSLERFYYNRAFLITTATEEIKRTIVKMGISEKKVVTLVNTVNTSVFKPLPVSRKKINVGINEFIIIYIGSLTQVQNLGTVITAAQTLKKFENIRFLLVGEGEDKENLISQTKSLKLKNITFIDGQPTEKIIELMNAADLGLISLSKNKFFSDNALPTKTSEYLGCGKPIVACAGKNLKDLIEENKVGLVVEPGDSEGLAKAILKFYKNKALVRNYSQNARRLAISKFSDDNFFEILKNNLP